MIELPKTYEACIALHKAEGVLSAKQWAVGDAAVEELGPTRDRGGRPKGAKTGDRKIDNLLDALKKDGIQYSSATIRDYRKTATMFPLTERIVTLSFSHHRYAETPDQLRRILEINPHPNVREVDELRKCLYVEQYTEPDDEYVDEEQARNAEARAREAEARIIEAEEQAGEILAVARRELEAAEALKQKRSSKAEAVKPLVIVDAEAKAAEIVAAAEQKLADAEVAEQKSADKALRFGEELRKKLRHEAELEAAKIIRSGINQANDILQKAVNGPVIREVKPKKAKFFKHPEFVNNAELFSATGYWEKQIAEAAGYIALAIEHFHMLRDDQATELHGLLAPAEVTIRRTLAALEEVQRQKTGKHLRVVE